MHCVPNYNHPIGGTDDLKSLITLNVDGTLVR